MAQKSAYKDLEEESARYANGFKELGLKPGDRVSIQVNKCTEVIFIYLACVRSNLIFHPLNTAYKEKELSFFLNDAKPSVFICEREIYDSINLLDLEESIPDLFTLSLHDERSIQLIKKEGDHQVVDCSEDHTAALLYSSGTTGQPKGIMLTHANIGSNAKTLKDTWGFSNEDILLHVLPIYHVHGLFVALGCVLLSGSKMLWTESFRCERSPSIITSMYRYDGSANLLYKVTCAEGLREKYCKQYEAIHIWFCAFTRGYF